MAFKTYLKYPCGKLFEIRVPIMYNDGYGKLVSILPGNDNYFDYAKEKFEINNLKVIKQESKDDILNLSIFIPLVKKIKSIE